jgi:hypothetical protein
MRSDTVCCTHLMKGANTLYRSLLRNKLYTYGILKRGFKQTAEMDLARSEVSSVGCSCSQRIHELIRQESLCRRNKGRRVLVVKPPTQNRSAAPRRLLQICSAEARWQLRHVRKISSVPRTVYCSSRLSVRQGQRFS